MKPPHQHALAPQHGKAGVHVKSKQVGEARHGIQDVTLGQGAVAQPDLDLVDASRSQRRRWACDLQRITWKTGWQVLLQVLLHEKPSMASPMLVLAFFATSSAPFAGERPLLPAAPAQLKPPPMDSICAKAQVALFWCVHAHIVHADK
jgi:hypothetical protein